MDKLKGALSMAAASASAAATSAGSKDAGPGRPMKYPYTLTAKMAQFPYKWLFQNQWIFKYYVISCGVCLPLFYWIQRKTYSPENVAKWKDIRRKEKETHH